MEPDPLGPLHDADDPAVVNALIRLDHDLRVLVCRECRLQRRVEPLIADRLAVDLDLELLDLLAESTVARRHRRVVFT